MRRRFRKRRLERDKMVVIRRVFFPSHIGRLEYLFRFIFCIFLLGFYLMIVEAIGSISIQMHEWDWVMALLITPFLLIGIYIVPFVIAPRLRDAGIPALAALLVVVPVVNMLLSLAALFLPTGAMSGASRRY